MQNHWYCILRKWLSTGFVTLSDELLTQLAADSSPAGRAAALPGDVVTPGSVLTLTGLAALLPKVTLWAFYPHTHTHTHTHNGTIWAQNTFSINLNCNCKYICSNFMRLDG